ncbi:MAG: terpene cyclase/mutase family protein [Pirellulaceae bacterium]|jgi:DNA-binding transcriptional regulator YhcF (GntR family)|nr:terpene cyclase/mutase family protein [Pirellulaceae bacterium]MDP7015595.1 terpene cyclase/mutase family protein [Pirellulaceae bacterium]
MRPIATRPITTAFICSLLAPLTIVVQPAAVRGENRTEAVRAAISKSLPFIEAQGESWIKKKKCASCHHTPFMAWSLNEAARLGLSRPRVQEWNDWNFKFASENKGGGFDTMGQLVLGRNAEQDTEDRRAQLKQFAEWMVAAQLADGSFKPGGQLPSQKRPLDETTDVTAMWAAAALRNLLDAGLPEALNEKVRGCVERAEAFLDKRQTKAVSTEWWAAGLLLAQARGAETKRWEKGLQERQQDDGGWGWLASEPSDALATGMALFAISQSGDAGESVAAAQAFLLKTQGKDGAWMVKSTKKAKSKNVIPTSKYWGTTWAIIGLAYSSRRASGRD